MANPLLDIGNDNLSEISRKLEESHLAYLQTDESPLKLQQRKKLEGHIKEFLCLVPHGHKYVLHETADILRRSALTMPHFSGYRACTAWSAISIYAANLLSQPWRKEYQTLKTYNGYYKHEVETNLVGAELMFELMGYKHIGLGVMQLKGPIDPDKVSYVSRDSIVAFVECQILKQIWEAVSKKFHVTWLEVLQFRENHVCSPDQAIRALKQRFLERLNQSHHGHISYCQGPPAVIINSMSHGQPFDLPVDNFVPSYQFDYRYSEDPNAMPLYHLNSSYDPHYSPYSSYLPHSIKCVQSAAYTSPPMPTQCRVPTGRLIELDTAPPQEKVHNGKSCPKHFDYDQVDAYERPERYDYYSTVEKKKKTQESDDWDFVFQNLESQGYSKNLGDRDDILQQRHKSSEEKHQSRTLDKRKDKSFAEPKRHNHKSEFEMENGYSQKKGGNVRNMSPGVTEVMESMKRVMKLTDEPKEADEDANKWNCASCTYLNCPERDICEMCNKSKHKGNEDVPLASGSKECPQCTLINEKDAVTCAACENSLKDSPTYI